MWIRIAFQAVMLAVCAGCAAMPAALEVPSAILSLGSMGKTAVELTYADQRRSLAVGWLPPQYHADRARLVRELWELDFHLVKISTWTAEDLTWPEIVGAARRKGGDATTSLVLIRKVATGGRTVEEARPAGGFADPGNRPMRIDKKVVPHYLYSAYFFTRRISPSGILAEIRPLPQSCRGSGVSSAALVLAVSRKSVAERAVRPGDYLLAVNGQATDATAVDRMFQPGENQVRICREGRIGLVIVAADHPTQNKNGAR